MCYFFWIVPYILQVFWGECPMATLGNHILSWIQGRWIPNTGSRCRPKMDESAEKKAVALYQTKQYTLKEIKDLTGVSSNTIYRAIKGWVMAIWCIGTWIYVKNLWLTEFWHRTNFFQKRSFSKLQCTLPDSFY